MYQLLVLEHGGWAGFTVEQKTNLPWMTLEIFLKLMRQSLDDSFLSWTELFSIMGAFNVPSLWNDCKSIFIGYNSLLVDTQKTVKRFKHVFKFTWIKAYVLNFALHQVDMVMTSGCTKELSFIIVK